MALPHYQPAEPIDVRPLGDQLADARTATLFKTEAIEVIRMVLQAGKEVPPHDVPGDLILHCIEGKVVVSSTQGDTELSPGKLVYLPGSAAHSLRAIEDASLLVTIQLIHKTAEQKAQHQSL